MERNNINVLEIEKMIKSAISDAMVRYSSNYDDFYHGWDICPYPGVLINFSIEFNNPLRIKISKYITVKYEGTCIAKQMYFGIIPHSDDYKPDMGFIKQLLKNWVFIG